MQYNVNMDGNLYEMQNKNSYRRGDLLAFLGTVALIALMFLAVGILI